MTPAIQGHAGARTEPFRFLRERCVTPFVAGAPLVTEFARQRHERVERDGALRLRQLTRTGGTSLVQRRVGRTRMARARARHRRLDVAQPGMRRLPTVGVSADASLRRVRPVRIAVVRPRPATEHVEQAAPRREESVADARSVGATPSPQIAGPHVRSRRGFRGRRPGPPTTHRVQSRAPPVSGPKPGNPWARGDLNPHDLAITGT